MKIDITNEEIILLTKAFIILADEYYDKLDWEVLDGFMAKLEKVGG